MSHLLIYLGIMKPGYVDPHLEKVQIPLNFFCLGDVFLNI